MKKNHLTLIIQSSGAAAHHVKKTATLSLHKRVLLWLPLCIILLTVFGINGSQTLIKNQFLRQRIAVLEASLKNLPKLERTVQRVRAEERMIRGFLVLDDVDTNSDRDTPVGIGGSGDDPADGVASFDAMAEIEDIADKRPLHIQVSSLRDDLIELKTSLSRVAETLSTRPTIMPVRDNSVYLTSGFGWRISPFTGMRQFHSALDIAGRKGALIVAAADGVVSSVGSDRLFGNYVQITHDNRFETAYSHLLKSSVKEGARVKRGQVIGLMGSTGLSTGYHLHYEITDKDKKVNPYQFILNRENIRQYASRR